LAQISPDDARPLFPRRSGDTDDDDERGLEYPCVGLTLIMACRSRQRAEAARAQLVQLFEHDVARSMRGGAPSSDGTERIAAFRASLVVAIHVLDLASVQSTLAFASQVART